MNEFYMSVKGMVYRIYFMFFVCARLCNPNGDPDLDNMPRIVPETGYGYMTDVSIKRRIRDYIQMVFSKIPGMNILAQQAININRVISEAYDEIGAPKYVNDTETPRNAETVTAAQEWLFKTFYDVRTFGAVLSTGQGAGNVLGPVQISYGDSLDPIYSVNDGITRVYIADDTDKGCGKSVEDYDALFDKTPERKLRTMGRKSMVPYALYQFTGYVNPFQAQKTGFTEKDFGILLQAISHMYEFVNTSSKTGMEIVGPIVLFRRAVDTTQPEDVQVRQAMLGRGTPDVLRRTISVHKRDGVEYPRCNEDYEATVDFSKLPSGVEIGFFSPQTDEVTWGKLPEEEYWMKAKN